MKRKISLLGGAAVLTALFAGSAFAGSIADTVFYGDNIITMDVNNPEAEAVAVDGEKIIYVGDKKGASKLVGDETRVVELGDKALTPGFIDSHGHVSMAAAFVDFVNASSPPVGPVKNIDDILDLLRKRIAEKPPAEGEWVLAYGYDDSLIEENRHPTRDDLDKVSKTIPIYMLHVSGHLGTSNSAALAAAGFDENTKDPEGGVIRRYPGTTKPNGVLEEGATHKMLLPQMGKMQDPKNFMASMKGAIDYFTSYGITTIQDGASMYPTVLGQRQMNSVVPLGVDIASFPVSLEGAESPLTDSELKKEVEQGYKDSVHVGGVKYVLDGSPQGRTAWLTEPYDENPDDVHGHYVAYPTLEPEAFKKSVARRLHASIPVMIHTNGDAAMDLAMDAVEEAFAGQELPDHRTVLIHAQVMREDQVDRAKKLKMVPSFYSVHTFFWGDWHRKSFGEDRAAHISPTKSALDKGVHFTIHNDTPVVPPDMMRLMWSTVNRETRSGFVLGPDQRISPYDALYAMTMAGAYQYFEEDVKGSLTVGKQADLVVLGANPLTVDPKTIKDIPVLETIAHGKTVFAK